MMDKNLAAALFYAAIIVLIAIVFVVMFYARKRMYLGWEAGRQENERYHRFTVDAMRSRIEARECALAMYRDISTTLCDNESDCMYCPYEREKNDGKCALWKLNDAVRNLGIAEVHVRTKHDDGDCD